MNDENINVEEYSGSDLQNKLDLVKPSKAKTFFKWLVLVFSSLIIISAPTFFYTLQKLATTETVYQISSPSLQYDLLSSGNITVDSDSIETFNNSEGSLYITTVAVQEKTTALDVVIGWLDPESDVFKEEDYVKVVYNVPTAIIDYNQDEMDVSINFALASGFDYLKIPYDSSLDLADVTLILEDGKTLKEDYVTLLELNGKKISKFKEVESYLYSLKDDSPVNLKIKLKNGDEHDMVVKPTYSETLERYSLGFYALPRFDFPVDYKFNIKQVQGGSAGLMLALSVVESLTEEKMLPKAIIGGTGAISSNGEVLEIAGLRQKLIAAEKNKNEFFFIPSIMCEQVDKKYNMKIIPVETLSDALSQIKHIKENHISQLNQCKVSK